MWVYSHRLFKYLIARGFEPDYDNGRQAYFNRTQKLDEALTSYSIQLCFKNVY